MRQSALNAWKEEIMSCILCDGETVSIVFIVFVIVVFILFLQLIVCLSVSIVIKNWIALCIRCELHDIPLHWATFPQHFRILYCLHLFFICHSYRTSSIFVGITDLQCFISLYIVHSNKRNTRKTFCIHDDNKIFKRYYKLFCSNIPPDSSSITDKNRSLVVALEYLHLKLKKQNTRTHTDALSNPGSETWICAGASPNVRCFFSFLLATIVSFT